MLDQEFCDFLEHHLTTAFSNSNDTDLKSFWCDGILLPMNDDEYSKKTINDKRKVVLKAFAGKDGQDEYLLLMKFGNKSLSKYAKDQDIKDCLPAASNSEWYTVDFKTKTINIQLF